MRTSWSELLYASLHVKYDKGQVCVCVRNRKNLMFGILLKNDNNEKNILNTKGVKSRSHTFQAINCQVQLLLHCKENSHFFLYNSGLGSSLAG